MYPISLKGAQIYCEDHPGKATEGNVRKWGCAPAKKGSKRKELSDWVSEAKLKMKNVHYVPVKVKGSCRGLNVDLSSPRAARTGGRRGGEKWGSAIRSHEGSLSKMAATSASWFLPPAGTFCVSLLLPLTSRTLACLFACRRPTSAGHDEADTTRSLAGKRVCC